MASFVAEHVKFRTGTAGKSPIGSVHVFKECVEWRDGMSPHRHKIEYGAIKVTRVSPPEKSKVQLQITMHNDEQATFVFVRPSTTTKELAAERDELRDRIQQALHAHRQGAKKMTKPTDNSEEVGEKKKILESNNHLGGMCKLLVYSNLLTWQEFWADRFNTKGEWEDRRGSTGAFLASIAKADADGLKLFLNSNIIQTIFSIYPVVERKHLELVPHLMSEEEFWVKFASSHYFHRGKEVLPNPEDPFADCVKADEEEMSKLVRGGAKRRRLNFDYLSDNIFTEINKQQRPDTTAAASNKQRAMLIRRCNYLSERILQTTLQMATAAESAAGAPSTNGTASNGLNAEGECAVLNHWMGDASEDALESAELAEEETELQLVPIEVHDGTSLTVSSFPPDEATRFRSIVSDFNDNVTEMDILDTSDDWLASPSTSSMNGDASNGFFSRPRPFDPTTQWGPLTPYVAEIRVVHDAVNELVKHFWTCFCFPPMTPEMEAKIERMEQALRKCEQTVLVEAEQRFGVEAFSHSREMVRRAHERYADYKAKMLASLKTRKRPATVLPFIPPITN